jgi:hypothetical protein
MECGPETPDMSVGMGCDPEPPEMSAGIRCEPEALVNASNLSGRGDGGSWSVRWLPDGLEPPSNGIE